MDPDIHKTLHATKRRGLKNKFANNSLVRAEAGCIKAQTNNTFKTGRFFANQVAVCYVDGVGCYDCVLLLLRLSKRWVSLWQWCLCGQTLWHWVWFGEGLVMNWRNVPDLRPFLSILASANMEVEKGDSIPGRLIASDVSR